MAPINLKLYRKLHEAYKNAYVGVSHAKADVEVAKVWNSLKTGESFPNNVEEQIQKWKKESIRKRATLDQFWAKIPKKSESASVPDVEVIDTGNQATSLTVKSLQISNPEIPDVGKNELSVASSKTPVQDDVRKNITDLELDILHLTERKAKNLASADQIKDLERKKKEVRELQKVLKNLIQTQERKRNQRKREKELLLENPSLAEALNRKSQRGKTRLEETQPELLKTIIDLATYGSAVDERRRSGSLRTIKTLDDLTRELNLVGFQISRSALYLRLQPKRSNSSEGKRHVVTVPVRLIRSTNDTHKEHVDTQFCKTAIGYLEQIASVLGKTQVLFVSQDDKARVPIGLTAASKQAPLLMHLDYRIRLPDHDWVVAEKHKLIPSVYAIMNIGDQHSDIGDLKAVGYSGPTFIAIRSGKHCSSTSSSHARDFDKLLTLEDACAFTRCASGEVKPVVIITVDGGPDENPRYEKVINCAIRHFLKYDLDCLFLATNAPGRSAFNRVERRMAPLSRELAGVILPHDTFGSHLDANGKTIDNELEKLNFKQAGDSLAEIWSSIKFDGFNTTAEYVDPTESEVHDIIIKDAEWKSRHVREGHYFLQVTKCGNAYCCQAPRGNYFKIFPRFIPAPICFNQKTMSSEDNADQSNIFPKLLLRLRIDDSKYKNVSGEVPFDLCCPSVRELVQTRTCKICGIYFSSNKSLQQHRKTCGKNPTSDLNNPVGLQARKNNRPVRLAARRQKEKMILWTSRINDEHCDWFDDDELTGIVVDEPISNEPDSVPIIPVEAVMTSQWE